MSSVNVVNNSVVQCPIPDCLTSNVLFKAVSANYVGASALAIGSGVLCAAAATEMVLQTIGEAVSYLSNGPVSMNNVSANIGGAIFYGLCAANIIPGTSFLGAFIFTCYSIIKNHTADDYVLTKFLQHTFTLITDVTRSVVDNVIAPLYKKIVRPVLIAIIDVVDAIVSAIPLPEHPVWQGVALLGTAIIIVKVALPALGVSIV